MKRRATDEINVEEYYTRYGPMVLRRCRRLLQDEERAYDAMQEVFVKLLHYKDRLKGTYPSSLLYRIATNICLNKIRDERPTIPIDEKEILSNVAHQHIKNDDLDTRYLLDFIFKGEKESTHRIAVMYFVDGMTLKEIASLVGLSVSGVHKRLRDMRLRFKRREVLNEQ